MKSLITSHFLKFKSSNVLKSMPNSCFLILHTLIKHNTLHLIHNRSLLLTYFFMKTSSSKKEYPGEILKFLNLFESSQVTTNFTCNVLSKLHTRSRMLQECTKLLTK